MLTPLFIAVSNARIVGDRDVLVQFGSDINLTCRSKDSPQPPSSVMWYKDGVRVDSLLARYVCMQGGSGGDATWQIFDTQLRPNLLL